jgi:hypothetical protein
VAVLVTARSDDEERTASGSDARSRPAVAGPGRRSNSAPVCPSPTAFVVAVRRGHGDPRAGSRRTICVEAGRALAICWNAPGITIDWTRVVVSVRISGCCSRWRLVYWLRRS